MQRILWGTAAYCNGGIGQIVLRELPIVVPFGMCSGCRQPECVMLYLMKTRNKRELEKHWAKEAANKSKPNKQTPRRGEVPNQAAAPTGKETAKE